MRKRTSLLVVLLIVISGGCQKEPSEARLASPELSPARSEVPPPEPTEEPEPEPEPAPPPTPTIDAVKTEKPDPQVTQGSGGAAENFAGTVGKRAPKKKSDKIDLFDDAKPSVALLEGSAEPRQQRESKRLDAPTRRRKAKKIVRQDVDRGPAPVDRPAPDVVEIPDLLEELGDFDGFENQVVETTTEVAKDAIDTRIDPKSTFSIDVDTGGYTLARARLREGYRPKPEDVRIEEFLNYFHYDYAPPVDAAFSINMESAPDPVGDNPREHLLRIGVQGKQVPDDARPPAHLTFLVDVSGSMFGPDRLGLVIEALDLATRNLREDDTIAVVTYAMGAEVALWPAGAKERDLAAAAIARLEPGGSSDMDEGLELAYEVASTHFTAGDINRVVLLGDGRANVGRTTPTALLRSVQASVEDGVMLSTIGFGAKAFNDHLMEQLADRGNGNYFFVDSYHEAQRVFRDRLCGTIFAIANDVKIQVEFNPESVKSHRLLGYENRRLEHQQFRDDKVDAGEIGAGHSVTAIYAIELQPKLDETIASVGVRFKNPGEQEASELTFQFFSRELHDDVREASADFKFAAAVALFAQIARGDERGGADRLSLIQEIASEGLSRGAQPDREEFVALVAEAAPFYGR